MRAYSLLLFYLCLNLAAFILVSTDIIPVGDWIEHTPTDISAMFSLTTFSALVAGGTIGGLVALLTRQYALSAGLILVWCVGILYEPISWVLIGVPKILNAILPAELSVLGTVVGVLTSVVFFMFFIEVLGGRTIT